MDAAINPVWDDMLRTAKWTAKRMIKNGEVFGKLTVTHGYTKRRVWCRCSCGATCIAVIDDLVAGKRIDCRGRAHGIPARVVS